MDRGSLVGIVVLCVLLFVIIIIISVYCCWYGSYYYRVNSVLADSVTVILLLPHLFLCFAVFLFKIAFNIAGRSQ
jgi:hypothetical protein